MIFVTVGISRWPFDRLLEAVGQLQTDEEVIAQCGVTATRPSHLTCVDTLCPDEFEDNITAARLVVSHAGIGSVGACLRNGKKPIVVPRAASLRECVDDHQIRFARQLRASGVAAVVEDISGLQAAIARNDLILTPTTVSGKLVDDLVSFISHYVEPEPLDSVANGRVGPLRQHPRSC